MLLAWKGTWNTHALCDLVGPHLLCILFVCCLPRGRDGPRGVGRVGKDFSLAKLLLGTAEFCPGQCQTTFNLAPLEFASEKESYVRQKGILFFL